MQISALIRNMPQWEQQFRDSLIVEEWFQEFHEKYKIARCYFNYIIDELEYYKMHKMDSMEVWLFRNLCVDINFCILALMCRRCMEGWQSNFSPSLFISIA